MTFQEVFAEYLAKDLRRFPIGDDFKYRFPNGYIVSVIRHPGSYGYEAGLWEVAIVDNKGNFFLLNDDYIVQLYDGIFPSINDEQVFAILAKVRILEADSLEIAP